MEQNTSLSPYVYAIHRGVWRYVNLCVPVCGVQQTAGGAYEVAGGTDNWKRFNFVTIKLFK